MSNKHIEWLELPLFTDRRRRGNRKIDKKLDFLKNAGTGAKWHENS